jgi:methyl-accepting chemotaxis protein
MLKNMKIGMRLLLGFGVVLVLMVLSAVYSTVSLKGIHTQIDLVANDRIPKMNLANDVQDQVNVIARAIRNELLVADPASVEKEDARVLEARAKSSQDLDKLKETVPR